jgi:organic hydroperoxide reductase OsmC/OhrA
MKQHTYAISLHWTGNDGEGTKNYKSYRRDHAIVSPGKPELPGSSDPSFRGDPSRYNPEELLVAALSSCHMLWYLHLCAINHITVLAYTDTATGVMRENADGSGEFLKVNLKPATVLTAGDDRAKAIQLHHEAHHLCFIARSVNFPVEVEPQIREQAAAAD